MKTKQVLVLLLGASFLIGLYRCSVEKKSFVSVNPPFKNVDVRFDEFKIESSVGDTLLCETGSSIIIPKDAFVDENGNTYNGELIIKYREFHNSTDILASGITMTYDSAGEKLEFQTAGMFEIKAAKFDNSALYLAADKQVVVNMASYVDGSAYNFYHLDEKSGWQYKGKTQATINAEKQKLISLIPDTISAPIKPNDLNKNEKVFNLSFNEREHPELKDFSDVVWQYSGMAGDSIHDPALNKWVYTYTWEKADLGKYNSTTMDFELLLSARGKKFSTTVKPVLSGEKLKTAMKDFEKKLKNYTVTKERRKNAEELAQKQGDFVRSFSVQNFGIYNWDCILKQPNRMALNADFKFDGDIGVSEENLTVYLVTGSDRSLVTYYYGTWSNFSFDPSASNKLVVVLPGNKIAVFDEDQFKQLDIEKIKYDKAYTFQLHVNNATIKSMDGLSKAINS